MTRPFARAAAAAIAPALLLSGLAFPAPVAAQTAREYGKGDICKPARGRPTVRCHLYPRGVLYHRKTCRWVEEVYAGDTHGFELCRGADGVWRPSGRG